MVRRHELVIMNPAGHHNEVREEQPGSHRQNSHHSARPSTNEKEANSSGQVNRTDECGYPRLPLLPPIASVQVCDAPNAKECPNNAKRSMMAERDERNVARCIRCIHD